MSSEKLTSSHEHELNPAELENMRHERQEQLKEQHERAGEQSHENLEDARREALEKAQSLEKLERSKQERQLSPAEKRGDHPINNREREASFNATMDEVRTHMSPSSRTFSKVIHNKTVEKLSDVTGSTIARPDAILSGAVVAFALTLGVYLLARNMGYTLSGFETIGAFVLGWAIGIVYDFLKVMITGRK